MESRHQIASFRVFLYMHKYLFFNEFKFPENLMLECEFCFSCIFISKKIFLERIDFFFSQS